MHSDVFVWMVVRGSLVISPSAKAVELKVLEPETVRLAVGR